MYAVTKTLYKIDYEIDLINQQKDGRCFLHAH